jgi:hypothetical protein
MVDAVRALALGSDANAVLDHSAGYYAIAGLLWCAGLTIMFGIVANTMYHRTSGHRRSQPSRTLSRMHG